VWSESGGGWLGSGEYIYFDTIGEGQGDFQGEANVGRCSVAVNEGIGLRNMNMTRVKGALQLLSERHR